MRTFRYVLRPAFGTLLLALTFALTLSACDSDSDGGTSDVAGRYTVSNLVFVTEASSLDNADIGAELSTAEFQLFENGSFDFEFQLRDNALNQISGEFGVEGNEVNFNFNNSQGSDRQMLLLEDRLTLVMNGGTLMNRSDDNNDTYSVNLERFDAERFAGVTSARGQLQITMARQ